MQPSTKPCVKPLIGALLLFLLLSLTACASNLPMRAAPEAPPLELLAPCPTPTPIVVTNADLALYVTSLQHSLALCDAQVRELANWAAGLPKD